MQFSRIEESTAHETHCTASSIRTIGQWSVRVRTLKAEQYSFVLERTRALLKDTHNECRAADAENIRPFNLIPTLAIIGRRNPDRLVSSVVDLRMYVIAIALGVIQ